MQTSELIDFGSKILRKSTNSHRIDAEIILSHILKISREKILISENQVSKTNISKFKHLINRRLCNEPIAYILNKKEFRSKDFFVDKKSLIPRPETETLTTPTFPPSPRLFPAGAKICVVLFQGQYLHVYLVIFFYQ